MSEGASAGGCFAIDRGGRLDVARLCMKSAACVFSFGQDETKRSSLDKDMDWTPFSEQDRTGILVPGQIEF